MKEILFDKRSLQDKVKILLVNGIKTFYHTLGVFNFDIEGIFSEGSFISLDVAGILFSVC